MLMLLLHKVINTLFPAPAKIKLLDNSQNLIVSYAQTASPDAPSDQRQHQNQRHHPTHICLTIKAMLMPIITEVTAIMTIPEKA